MADRFGLSNIGDGVRKRADELAHQEAARVRSYDDQTIDDSGPMKPFTYQQSDYDRTEAPKDEMRKYWRQFETTPILRKPITSFASQVTEPGYYIQAKDVDDDTLRELDHWLQKCAIIEGEVGKDFRLLAKKTVIQREVRGTALIEKAPSRDDEDRLAGLKLINPETMEAVTRPGQSILLEPDDTEKYDDAPRAESGGAAAYLQDLSETQTFFGTPVRKEDRDDDGDYKVGFTRDEIIKLTRDADVGEVFGTSRIEAVSDRVEGIKQKLDDNDQAISSKAYPLWLFLFGSEENPWEAADINQFMQAHEMDQFHPGMKQGVRGDVDVKTISGEVAEIAEYIQFDIDWIMSAMPLPKYALGSFEASAVGQVGGVAQQQDVNRQINEARREIEEEFSPLLREVAIDHGVSEDVADDIYLRIGEPGEPETEVPRRENVIRYVPKDQREPSSDEDVRDESPGSEGDDGPTIDDGIITDPTDATEEEPNDSEGAQVWHTDVNFEELSFDGDGVLADKIYETFNKTLNATLNEVEEQYKGAPSLAATNFERIADRTASRYLSRGHFRRHVRDPVRNVIEEVSGQLGRNGHSFSNNQNQRFYVQNIENSTEDALEEMLRLARLQVRRGVTQNDDWSAVRSRIEEKFNDANLRQRAELIANMELHNAQETTKLQEWERDPDVVGVRVVNENATTPLTQSLHGTEAYFADGDLRSQLMKNTREQFLQKGFDPLPPTPPFHFNDTTTLEPIMAEPETEEEDELEESEDDGPSIKEVLMENARREEEVRRKKEALMDELGIDAPGDMDEIEAIKEEMGDEELPDGKENLFEEIGEE